MREKNEKSCSAQEVKATAAGQSSPLPPTVGPRQLFLAKKKTRQKSFFFCFHPGCSALGMHHPTWPLSGGGTLDAALGLGGGGFPVKWLCMVCRVFLPFVDFSHGFSFPWFCGFSFPAGLWDFPSPLLICRERGSNPGPSACEAGAISFTLLRRGLRSYCKNNE